MSTACRPRRHFLRSLFALAFCSLMLATAGTDLRAQCPVGWLGPFSATMNVTLNCGGVATVVPATVFFCIPGPGIIPQTQYMITSISQIPPFSTPCIVDSTTFEQLGRDLITINPAGYTCSPNCPNLFPQFNVTKGGCWKEVVTRNGQGKIIGIDYVACTGPAAHACSDYYIVCCEAGVDGICGTIDDVLTPFYQGSSTPECAEPLPCYGVCSSGGRAPEPVQCGGPSALIERKGQIK